MFTFYDFLLVGEFDFFTYSLGQISCSFNCKSYLRAWLISHILYINGCSIWYGFFDIWSCFMYVTFGWSDIKLSEDVGTTLVVNTLTTRFQPYEDEFLIQSWLNISKDSIVGVNKKGDNFWKRIGEPIISTAIRIFKTENQWHWKGH